jgi:hypothetical protein
MGPPARVGVSARERWIRPTVSRATFLSRREDETTTPRTRPLSLPSRLLTHGRSCCTNDSVCVWTDRPFTYSLWSPLSNNARYRHTCLLQKGLLPSWLWLASRRTWTSQTMHDDLQFASLVPADRIDSAVKFHTRFNRQPHHVAVGNLWARTKIMSWLMLLVALVV